MSKFRNVFRIVAVAGVLAWAGAAVLIPASASTTPQPGIIICFSCG